MNREMLMSYPRARVDKQLAEGMVHAHIYGHDIRLWVRTARGCTKEHICQVCGTTVAKGTKVYRPMSNGNDRMYRLCVPCVEKEE